jgi:hypothetical protein
MGWLTDLRALPFLTAVMKDKAGGRLPGERLQGRGIEVVYYFYNEDTRHHFNFWMVPRYPWMARFGKSIEAVRPAMIYARDNLGSEGELAVVAEAAEKLQAILCPRWGRQWVDYAPSISVRKQINVIPAHHSE